MVEKNSAWRAEPLTWGQGSRVFEVFLEPTCPFSAKAFGKLDETLQSAGANNVTLKIWLHSQPWHLFSGVITRCALAASTLGEGKGAAKKVLAGVAAHRGKFEPADHCSGPLLALSPADVIARVEEYSGLKLAEAYALPKGFGPGGQATYEICPSERHPCFTDLHDRWPGPERHEQRRRGVRLGFPSVGELTGVSTQ